MITNSNLHYTILRTIIDQGYAPGVKELSKIFETDQGIIVKALKELQAYHGVVLHPNTSEIWVIHPFSMAPTNFYVESSRVAWWGNCAWCSLGIAALLKENVTITTTIGAATHQVKLHIVDGILQEKNYFIHFPIPMKNAWDNVIYTCSTMLLFENESQLKDWCNRHNIPQGDLQPIDKIWAFSQVWYGNHLNPDWKKWTVQEAGELFSQFDLTHKVWELKGSKERF